MRAKYSIIVVTAGALCLLVGACTGSPGATTATIETPAAVSSRAAVEALVTALEAGDFVKAARLTIPGQAALASLAEGASVDQVLAALDDGGDQVAVNFWSGFAQSAGELLGPDVAFVDLSTVEKGGRIFHLVSVTPSDGSTRRIVTQDLDGHLIDLFASFGSSLAGRMIDPVESLTSATTGPAAQALAELGEVSDSLLVAAEDPTLTPQDVQSILQLVELITRFG